MGYYLIRTIEALLTPPGFMFLLMLLGGIVARRHPHTGRRLAMTGLILLLVCSLPVTSRLLFLQLENTPPLVPAELTTQQAGAIVILGGGRYSGPEYGAETVSVGTLQRLRYGIWLQDQTGLPILVSGGSPQAEPVPEAHLMAQTLQSAFHRKAQWLEEKSRNTQENAIFSQQLLQKSGIKRIFLVTHANHMPRSAAAFRQAGFEVIPAPLGFHARQPLSLLDFLPSGRALADSRTAGHELLGRLWYLLRY
ncbi:MAG: YdcF family protein [Gammaproteobacteria bacterium]|nr:YdcF family protein [Gammaproteobacteria bacterium]MDH5652437.1 YdcF family protein [Gammaproteobacteria bacterium]